MLSIVEFAKVYNCNPVHIRRMFHEGKLKGEQFCKNGRIWIDETSYVKQIEPNLPTNLDKLSKKEQLIAFYREIIIHELKKDNRNLELLRNLLKDFHNVCRSRNKKSEEQEEKQMGDLKELALKYNIPMEKINQLPEK